MIRAHLKELSVEEFANTITHGFGLALSLVGFAVLLVLAGLRGDALSITGCVVYGLSLVILYGASTMYHSAIAPDFKEIFRVLDHCGIYLLIAGSYTPFGLIIVKGALGQNLLIAIWAFAVIGILLKLFLRDRFTALSVVSYIVMGWIGVFAIQPLIEALGVIPVILVVAGGVAYTFGVIFFAWQRLPHNHAIFHVFVLVGSILHYAAVVLYVVPYSIKL
ncbi:MAG: hemolysin III family protein [Pyrinomonadaceae bacterium]